MVVKRTGGTVRWMEEEFTKVKRSKIIDGLKGEKQSLLKTTWY